jgi:hypothetical protein
LLIKQLPQFDIVTGQLEKAQQGKSTTTNLNETYKKAEQPELMKELISAARIGRSLGVHLILATQEYKAPHMGT